MMKRLFAALALVVLGIGVAATPARATIAQCPNGHVCLYNWVNYNSGGGFWSTHVQNIYGSPNDCHNLPMSGVSGWPSGQVGDAATSYWLHDNSSGNSYEFHEWVNCNKNGDWFADVAGPPTGGHFSTWGMNDDVRSIKWRDID